VLVAVVVRVLVDGGAQVVVQVLPRQIVVGVRVTWPTAELRVSQWRA
jgi:hypothetical protein